MVEGEGLGSWTGWGPCHGMVVGGKVIRRQRYRQEGWRVDGLRQEDQVEWWHGLEGGWWHYGRRGGCRHGQPGHRR